MMIGNSSRKGKQEGDSDHNGIIEKYLYSSSKVGSSSSSSYSSWASSRSQWPSSGLRNPRIIRVSRTFGGKDRHSKVVTIKGLRDRRIRLSIPTAIQLYELQHRLDVSQPSKVIDWLIQVTKLDIDKLPPLQIPHGFPHQFLHPHHQQTLLPPPPPPPQIHLSSLNDGSNFNMDHERSMWEKGKWVMKTNNEDDGEDNNVSYNNNNSYHNYSGQYSSNLSLFGSHNGLFFPNNSNSQVDIPGLAHNSNSVQFQFPSNSSAASPVLPSSTFGPYYNYNYNMNHMTNNINTSSTIGEIHHHEPTRLHLNDHFHHHLHLHLPNIPTPVLPFTSSLLHDSHYLHNQKQDTHTNTGPS